MPFTNIDKMCIRDSAALSQEVGVPAENSFVLSNGDTILLNNGEARLGPRIHVEDIYVDGNDISGLSTAVPVSYTHLDVYKRQYNIFIKRHYSNQVI